MNKYAVLIGNSQFPDEADKSKLPALACPEKDVEALSKILASDRGEFDVLPLKNEPSYKILRELQRKVKQTESDDLLLLYYSGHGKPNRSGMLHLTTFDTVIAELETSAIPISRVYDILGTGKCKKIVIILDCCYSGAAGQGFKGAIDDQLQQLNNARGTYLVTASTELQVAHESAAEGFSLFTKHLIIGLETGEADKDGDGWVSMNELYDYVQSKVVTENPAQQPTKHVKEERCGLFITKSGRAPRAERAEKIRLLLLELEKQDGGIAEIKTEVLSIAKMSSSQLSAVQFKKDELLEQLLIQKTTPFSFLMAWDRIKPDTIKIGNSSTSTANRKVEAATSADETNENWQRIHKYKVKDGIAIDTETGLMWLRFAYGQIWKNATAEGNARKVNWETAFEAAKDFNREGGYAGYNDWRLPNIDELKTLIDKLNGEKSNYIDADVFNNNSYKHSVWNGNACYWSSSPKTSYFPFGALSHIVNFYRPVSGLARNSGEYAVRLVRSTTCNDE
uniref:caspase, EACC1-associated type n=1 Tax=Candidatus Electronema sp. TaxID=2698783 RepID=UPI0040574FC7